MKNLRKPAFFFGIAGAVVFFIGLAMKSMEYDNSRVVMYIGLLMGAIFWLWAIAEVIAADDLKQVQRMFWLILVVAVPVFGGLLFHFLHQRRNKIVT